MLDLAARWPEVRAAIEQFVANLPPGTIVELEAPLTGGFGADECGFDGPLHFQSISALRREAPSRATVTFYTGLPDGYATFAVELEAGRPISVGAFAS